jgi:hypothetical protein
MNMISGLFIALAVLLLWGAINLDRTTQVRVVDDQNARLNDSIEFLRNLKTKSPREESHGRRIDAYRETVSKAVSQNPESLSRIEKEFAEGTNSNLSDLESLLKSTKVINSNLKNVETQSTEMKFMSDQESKITVSNLTQLYSSIQDIQSSSSDFTKQSAVLAQDIAEVKEYLA